ncbi:MAG: 4Fe-4S binding protein [Synergistaceae bacterium]|jgi:Fe-S-cluster-containing dehydrogenase component|nr:4Fe-4S binding protein [Synergistaceae bacterium]
MTEVKIDLADCIGCKICYNACFIDVNGHYKYKPEDNPKVRRFHP